MYKVELLHLTSVCALSLLLVVLFLLLFPNLFYVFHVISDLTMFVRPLEGRQAHEVLLFLGRPFETQVFRNRAGKWS